MRWTVYTVAVLVALAFDTSLGRVLSVGEVQPRALSVVLVFTLLSIPRRLALRAAVFAGLAADLLSPAVQSDGGVLVLPGPHVLGFALGALALLELRGILYRQNPLAGAVATFCFSTAAAVVYVFLWGARGLVLGTDAPWWPSTGASEVMHRLLVAVADAVVAIPLLWVLQRTRPLWGFVSGTRVSTGLAREGT